MMQCAQAVQGWGHACELGGTTIFIYLGCFMHCAEYGLDTFEHSFAHGHSVKPYGYTPISAIRKRNFQRAPGFLSPFMDPRPLS